MNFEVIGQAVENAKIKVVGVGGAGGNAVIHICLLYTSDAADD